MQFSIQHFNFCSVLSLQRFHERELGRSIRIQRSQRVFETIGRVTYLLQLAINLFFQRCLMNAEKWHPVTPALEQEQQC